jgi:hypothetical protein
VLSGSMQRVHGAPRAGPAEPLVASTPGGRGTSGWWWVGWMVVTAGSLTLPVYAPQAFCHQRGVLLRGSQLRAGLVPHQQQVSVVRVRCRPVGLACPQHVSACGSAESVAMCVITVLCVPIAYSGVAPLSACVAAGGPCRSLLGRPLVLG